MDEMIADLPYRSRDEIDAVQERNFAATLDLVFERHPYYRQRFADMGLKRSDIGGLKDISRIPIIAKKDYMAEPEAFRMDCRDLPIEMQVTWDVMHTTGTSTGIPTPFYSTTYDFYNILTTNRRALEIRGVNENDIIANLCPLTVHPYGAYHRTIAAANAMKIPVVSPLPGKPSPYFHWSSGMDEVVATVARTRATILWGVASYTRRVILQAEENGADFSAVRLVFVTGEAVTEEMRDDMTRRLVNMGAKNPLVSVSYAATEMQVGTVECQPGAGYHNPAPDEFYFEVVDPESHKPLPDRQRGMAVMTHLNRRGTVLLRYALGDLTVLSREACPHCHATTDRFVEMPSRADDLVKVKGMLINPALLGKALIADDRVAEYQIVIDRTDPNDRLSMDRLTVRVAANVATGDEFAGEMAELVKAAVGVRPEIDLVDAREIFDTEKSLKSKRLIDLR